MIDWKKCPEAVQVTVNYLDENGDTIKFDVFASPTQKTVADAVEYYGETFVVGKWTHIRCGKDGKMFFASGEVESDNWQDSYLVCTRAEFEAYVKEQEGEKWTHTYGEHKCYIKLDEPDSEGYIVVVTEFNGYIPCKPENLKPIKPTISEDAKRQLELYVQYRVDKYGDYAMKSDLSDYLSYHDII